MRRSVVAAAAAALWAIGLAVRPAGAEPPGGEDGRDPSRLALEGLDRLMQALDLFIATLPQYEAPYINEDGDIIIRRKRNPAEPGAEPPPERGRPGEPEGMGI